LLFIIAALGAKAQNYRQINFLNKGVYFALRPGFSYDYMSARGSMGYLHFNRPRQKQLSLMMDWDADKFKGWMIRAEVSYKSMSFYGQGFESKSQLNTYEIRGFTLVPEVVFMYGSTRLNSLRIIGGIGLGLSGSTVTRNQFTIYQDGRPPVTNNKQFDAEGGDFIATINASLMYKRRWEANFKYWPFAWHDAINDKNRLNSHSISFALCYWL
jgi:hypothetical protein